MIFLEMSSKTLDISFFICYTVIENKIIISLGENYAVKWRKSEKIH